MKRTALFCLCAAIVFLAACGGSEESAELPAAAQEAEVNLDFGSLAEARDYLLANYSEEQLKEMYVEFSALSKADTEYYFEKDADGNVADAGQELDDAVVEKMSANIDEVIDRFGISRSLFAALMGHSATTDWGLALEEQIKARAAEILTKRSESADAPQ